MKNKITLDLPERNREQLETLAKHMDLSYSEVIRRAIMFYYFIDKQHKEGKKIIIADQEIIFTDFI
jgi:predicted transcriptional regulator